MLLRVSQIFAKKMEPKPDELVTCPFNMAHQVEHHRLLFHIAKCQKQYPDMHVVKCPFDSRHWVQEAELNHHVANCPQRGMLDSKLYITDDDHRPPVQVRMAQQDFACAENWDDDNATAYNPQEATKSVPVYRKIQGATKSQRKKERFQGSVEYSRMLASQQQSGSGSGNSGT